MNMKEALDRLRRYDAGETTLSIYGSGEYELVVSDLNKVAEGALHLTDPTPIDEAWLDTCNAFSRGGMSYTAVCGGEKGDATMEVELMLMDFGWAISLLQGVPDDPNVRDDHVLLTMLEGTRGELRSLAQLLKIELKEQA